MSFLLSTFGKSIVQDIVTAAAGYAVAHGYVQGSQKSELIGSLFFLGMAGLNWYQRHSAAQAKKGT